MLTLFSIPKPFQGHIDIIQRNAIKSWTLLQPRPEIILLGDDEGTAEIARELGLRHIPEVKRNEYGTPLVDSVFYTGQEAAAYPLVCYINADIILMSDFMNAVEKVIGQMKGREFLLVSRRWNVEITELWDFKDPEWESKLRSYVRADGKLDDPSGIDFFLFPKGLWEYIPPFALGRTRWDNWFIYQARAKGVPVIDGTPVITIVHQQHDYSHIKGVKDAKEWLKKGPEARRNLELRGGFSHLFTILDATYVLKYNSLKKASPLRHLRARLIRLQAHVSHLLTETLYPYSYPLVLVAKGVRRCFRLTGMVTSNLKRKMAKTNEN